MKVDHLSIWTLTGYHTDNGCQFNNQKFKKFYSELCIDLKLTSVGHLYFNGEAEVINHTILQGLKIKLVQVKRILIEELYNILWTYWITPWIAIGTTPFNLAFGVKAIVPVKIRIPSVRLEFYDEQENLSTSNKLGLA